jgi:cytochrome c oxidase subunit 4
MEHGKTPAIAHPGIHDKGATDLLVNHDHPDDGAVHSHVSSVKFYIGILAILVTFTLLTVAVASVHLGPLNLAVAILIASAKATLVVMFFMHLKYDNRFNATIVICSLMFIGVFFAYTMNDTETRGELDDAQGSMVLPATGQQAPGGLPGTASRHRGHERVGSFYAPNAGEEEEVAPEPAASAAGAEPSKGEVPVTK